jgi:DHA1 family multidrug resistance protein-like MFS transporter
MGGVLTDYLGMNAAFYGMAFFNLLGFLGVILFVPETIPKGKAKAGGSSFKEIAASRVMWGIFSYRMGISACRGIILTFLPVFAAIHVGLGTSQIGILLTLNALLVSVLQLPSGKLADRFNRRALVVLGSFMVVVSMWLTPSSNAFWYLIALFVLLSCGDAASIPAASAMVVQEGKIFGMGMVMAAFNVSIGIGQAVSPFLGGLIVDYININASFYFIAILMLICAGAFGWLTR